MTNTTWRDAVAHPTLIYTTTDNSTNNLTIPLIDSYVEYSCTIKALLVNGYGETSDVKNFWTLFRGKDILNLYFSIWL